MINRPQGGVGAMGLEEKVDKLIEGYNTFRIEDAHWKGSVDVKLDKALRNKARTEWLSATGAIVGGIFAGWFGGKASGG